MLLLLFLLVNIGCLTGCHKDYTTSDGNSNQIEESSSIESNNEETANDENTIDNESEIQEENNTTSTQFDDIGYEEIIHTYIEGLYIMDGKQILSVYPEKAINAHIDNYWTQPRDEFGIWHAEGVRKFLSDYEIESLMNYSLGTVTDLPEDVLYDMAKSLEDEIMNAYGENEAEKIVISDGKSIQILIPSDVVTSQSLTEYAIKIEDKWYLYPFNVETNM